MEPHKTARSNIPGATATGCCEKNALARQAYIVVTTVLALALAALTQYLLPRLRTQTATTSTRVPNPVPRPCVPSILVGPKLTTTGIDDLIDILVSDLIDHNVGSKATALPLARFACKLKIAMIDTRPSGEYEYTRLRRSFRESLRTRGFRFIPTALLMKQRAGDSKDELGQSVEDSEVSTKSDGIKRYKRAVTLPDLYEQLDSSLPPPHGAGIPGSRCRSSGENYL